MVISSVWFRGLVACFFYCGSTNISTSSITIVGDVASGSLWVSVMER